MYILLGIGTAIISVSIAKYLVYGQSSLQELLLLVIESPVGIIITVILTYFAYKHLNEKQT